MKSLLHASCSTAVLLIVLLVLCCGSLTIIQAEGNDSFSIGLVRSRTLAQCTGSVDGYLLVYSATDQFNDGDLMLNAHSSYSIYTTDGKLFKNVENHMSLSDEIPELVTLPPGSYAVDARSESGGYVRVRIIIRAGLRTVVDLNK